MSVTDYKTLIRRNELDYTEHYHKIEQKSKFNFLEAYIPLEQSNKYCHRHLLQDRKSPHQWIEFKNIDGDYYVVAYYYLGGYVVRIGIKNSYSWRLDNPKLKIFKMMSWYDKLKRNHSDVINCKNLFSMTEVAQIVSDVAKINKLSIFK